MQLKYKASIGFIALYFFAASASALPSEQLHTGWSIGANYGYGSSDWGYMVAHDTPSMLSTPVSASENGSSGGLSLTYSLNPSFRVAFNYTHFSDSVLNFSNPYSYDPNLSAVNTATSIYALEAELTHYINHSHYYGFSGVGLGVVHRKDLSATYLDPGPTAGYGYALQDKARLGGAFSAGLGRDISSQFNAEFGFQYLTGFAQSDNIPVYDYIPFTYYVYAQVGYHF